MKYKCENELSTLSFKDFGIVDILYENGKLTVNTDGGVAKYDNSCNEMLEERYISESEITFFNAQIVDFYLEGGKYYNADDVLLKEEPNKYIDEADYKKSLKELKKEGVIFFLSQTSDKEFYEIAVDVVNDTYWIKLKADKVSVSFDRFMNRVIN